MAVRLIALVNNPDHVCCRYRLLAYRPFLEAAGHTLEVRAWPRSWWKRWQLVYQLRDAHVIVQRRLLPGWQLALLRRAVRWLAFDFDDAVFLRDSYARRGLHHRGRLQRFQAMVRACDVVVAGNRFLAAQAGQWTDPSRVHVIPTCVDPRRYPVGGSGSVGAAGRRMQLVWVGSASTLQGLARVQGLLERLGQSVPGLELKLICDQFLELAHLPVRPCVWREDTEAEELARADVGISWIPDDEWSWGKCGLKVLQYMAAGLPVVANPVGVHPEMVTQGHTGFLVQTPKEWEQAVTQLLADPGLRQRMGEAGRQRVEQEYSVVVGARRWLQVLAHRAPRRSA